MTHLLPPNLLRLFAPRPPLTYAPPLADDVDPSSPPPPKASSELKIRPLDGVASFLERIKQERADRGEVTDDTDDSHFTHARVTLMEMAKERKRDEKALAKKIGLETYDPSKDPEASGDPFKTLFLARLSYEVTEKDLHREFDMYGPIEKIRVVRDKHGKSRGYAFILYERERDMRAAYKDAEGIKILGRRVMVDVERGRTVKDWKPARLGGGLGGTARKPKKVAEPEAAMGGFAGRGGFRGGFGGGRGAPRGGGGGFRGGGRGGFGGGPPRGGYGPPTGGGYGGPPSAGGYGADAPPSGRYGSGPPRSYGGGGYDDGPPNKRSRY